MSCSDHADHRALAGRDGPGLEVRRVPEVGDRLVHAVGEGLADPARAVVHDPGRGGQRHPGPVGDVLQRHPQLGPARAAAPRLPSGRTSATGPPCLLDPCSGPSLLSGKPFPETDRPDDAPEGWSMARKVIHVALNGVTGRMGYRQHLVRSLLAIREQGGVPLDDERATTPSFTPSRSWSAAARSGCARSPGGTACPGGPRAWTRCSATRTVDVYFDTQVTSARESAAWPGHRGGQARLHREAGGRLAGRRAARWPRRRGPRASPTAWCRTSCSCPAMIKLRRLVREGFFGRVLSVRLEFGYWVFEGDGIPAQRPVLELPRRGRRRHRARHVPALAVPA